MTPVLYASAWNLRLNEPLADEPFLDERDAADRFADGSGALTVVDGLRTEVRTPAWFIEIGSGPRPTRIDVQLLDSTGSVYLRADFRPQEGRLFCDRIISWVYPEHADLMRFNEAEAITTSTFEPDGSGALEIRDKTVPGPGIVMQAHDIPTEAHWVDFPEFGQWDSLLESVRHLNTPSAAGR